MADLRSILTDPNYTGANAATKKAIFERYSAQDPDYVNANAPTQKAIREKYGVFDTAPTPEGFATLQEIPGGGRLVRAANGQVSFTSPTFSTTDPEFIAQIQAGATMDQAMQSARDKALLSQPGQMAGARAATAARGVPFIGSYGDEVAGYVVPGGGERYQRLTSALSAQYPGQALAMQLAGVLGAGAGAVGLVTKVPSVLSTAQGVGRFSQAARVGATGAVGGGVEGAVYGAGEAQPGERVSGAISGGAMGAALGGGLGMAGVGAKSAIEEGVRRYKGLDIKATQDALSQSLGKPVSSETARVLQSFLQFEDFDNAQRVLDRIGEPGMMADISPGAAAVLDAMMAGAPAAMNAGREAVEGRVTKAMNDLGDVFDKELGSPLDPEDIKIGIAQETAAERDEAYKAAFEKPINYASESGQELERLVERVRSIDPKIIEETNALMIAAGRENRQIKAIVDADGNVKFEKPPDVFQLDYMTRRLNDVEKSLRASGNAAKADAVKGLVYQSKSTDAPGIRNILKDQIPEYSEALRKGQDKIRRQEAIDLGFDLIDKQMTRGEIARETRKLNTAQRKELARGLRSRIDEEMSNIAQVASDPNVDALELRNVIKKMSSDAVSTKLKTVLGAQKAKVIIDQIEDGLNAMRLRAAVSMNSKTAQRQAVIGETENILQGGILNSLKRIEPANTTKLMLQAITNGTEEAQAVRRSGVFEEMTQVLTQIRGQNAKDALVLIERAMKGQPLKDSQARLIANVITMPSAVALYTAARPEQETE